MKEVFTRQELEVLAEKAGRPQVTLMMPTHPVGDQWKQDPIRLRNLINGARRDLEALGVDGEEADAMLGPLEELVDADRHFWQQSGDGLAAFVRPGFSRLYRVPMELPEMVQVGDDFHVAPLVPLVQEGAEYFVLALSANGWRLLRCTRNSVTRVEVPGAPDDMEEAIPYYQQPNPRGDIHGDRMNRQTVTGAPTVQKQGFGDEQWQELQYREYFTNLDAKLQDVLGNESLPLVIASVDKRIAQFRDLTRYDHVLDHGVRGNPDLLRDEELRDKAWPLVEPLFHEDEERAVARFQQLVNTGRTTRFLRETLPAAMNGRVDTLLFAIDTAVWGRLDRDAQDFEVHGERQPGDVDLVNEAVAQALLNGARVYAVPQDQLPDREGGAVVNAILRW